MKYKIKKGLIFEKKGSKITIFDPEKFLLYELNETSSFIFSKLGQGFKKKQITIDLAAKYEIKKDKIENDIDQSIKFFIKKGFLTSGTRANTTTSVTAQTGQKKALDLIRVRKRIP
jgi:hypothetical protein